MAESPTEDTPKTGRPVALLLAAAAGFVAVTLGAQTGALGFGVLGAALAVGWLVHLAAKKWAPSIPDKRGLRALRKAAERVGGHRQAAAPQASGRRSALPGARGSGGVLGSSRSGGLPGARSNRPGGAGTGAGRAGIGGRSARAIGSGATPTTTAANRTAAAGRTAGQRKGSALPGRRGTGRSSKSATGRGASVRPSARGAGASGKRAGASGGTGSRKPGGPGARSTGPAGRGPLGRLLGKATGPNTRSNAGSRKHGARGATPAGKAATAWRRLTGHTPLTSNAKSSGAKNSDQWWDQQRKAGRTAASRPVPPKAAASAAATRDRDDDTRPLPVITPDMADPRKAAPKQRNGDMYFDHVREAMSSKPAPEFGHATEVMAWNAELPEFVGDVAAQITGQADAVKEALPIHADYGEALGKMGSALASIADEARETNATWEKAHEEQIERLTNPQPNAHKWNVLIGADGSTIGYAGPGGAAPAAPSSPTPRRRRPAQPKAAPAASDPATKR